jgi:hypothetical protein
MPLNLLPSAMNAEQFAKAIAITPKEILSSNSKLRKDGIQNITMPSYKGYYLSNGKLTEKDTCPNAGACKAYCYAGAAGLAGGGTYRFRASMVKHSRNLNYVMNDPFEFANQLVREIKIKRNLRAVRWHDSGDIMSEGYWGVMKAVMNALPNVQFYCYTKQISFMKSRTDIPANFTYVFSTGGTEDHLIDTQKDRHAKIFHSRQALRDAGYSDGTNTDRLASNPQFQKIGLVIHQNHKAMPKFRKMIAKLNKPKLLQVA